MIRIINRLEFALLIRAAAGTLGKYTCVVCLSSHWFACLFAMVGPGAVFGPPPSTFDASHNCYWLPAAESPGDNEDCDPDFSTKKVQLEQYAAALYWSIATLTSVGYGDISAANTRQRVVSIFVMIVGACLFGYGVSTIVAIIGDLYSTDGEFRSQMDRVNSLTCRGASV